ncbi:MAG: thioredoxin family protein [Thiohalomonadales bacterium]
MFKVLIKTGSIIFFFIITNSSALASDENAVFKGSKATHYPEWFKEGFLNLNEDVAEAAQQNKRLMLIFHQPGCPYCNALVERNLAQKDIEQKVRKNFDVISINMWGDREIVNIGSKTFTEKSFAEALKVQFTPTILFFNEQGKIILRLNGYLPPNRFKIAINWVADKQEKDISYRNYVAKNSLKSIEKNNGQLISEKYFLKQPYDISKLKNNKKNKPYALLFEQKDCPNCTLLHSKVLSEKSTLNIINQFSIIQLDMWADTPITDKTGIKTTAKQLAKKYDVKYAPTIIVFNAEGMEIIRSEAFFKTFHTQGIFHYVLSESYKKQPSFQRYLSKRAEHFIESGVAVDIWGYKGDTIPASK